MQILGSKAGGNPVRVALFLAEKGVDMEYEPIDLLKGEHRSKEFVAKNPFAQVPVLELDDGTCISETIAICRYFERLYPEPNLMGQGALDESIIEMWQRRVEFDLYLPARAVFRHSSPYVKALEPVQIAEWADLNRPRVKRALELIDRQLSQSQFVACNRYTVADITLLFCMQMLERLGISPADAGQNIQRWHSQVLQRSAVKEVLRA